MDEGPIGRQDGIASFGADHVTAVDDGGSHRFTCAVSGRLTDGY